MVAFTVPGVWGFGAGLRVYRVGICGLGGCGLAEFSVHGMEMADFTAYVETNLLGTRARRVRFGSN